MMDKFKNMKSKKKTSKWYKMEVIFELIVFGVVIGMIEDIIAIKITTGEMVTWEMVGIIVLVAVPFAILGEVVFDKIDFASIFRKIFSKKG